MRVIEIILLCITIAVCGVINLYWDTYIAMNAEKFHNIAVEMLPGLVVGGMATALVWWRKRRR